MLKKASLLRLPLQPAAATATLVCPCCACLANGKGDTLHVIRLAKSNGGTATLACLANRDDGTVHVISFFANGNDGWH